MRILRNSVILEVTAHRFRRGYPVNMKRNIIIKSKKRQNAGNKSASEGIAYQCMTTTSLCLRMLLYDEYKFVKQNNHTHVDDILTETENGQRKYYQCKTNGDRDNGGFSQEMIKGITIDFYKQYCVDKNKRENSRYILVSQSKPKNLASIIDVTRQSPERGKTLEEHIKSSLSNSNLRLFEGIYAELSKIKELDSENSDTKIQISFSKKDYIDFLNKIELWSKDFQSLKDDFYKQLTKSDYPKYIYHVLTTTLMYDWLSKNVSRNDIINLLKDLGIEYIETQDRATAPKGTINKKKSGQQIVLLKTDERFYNKLIYILNFIQEKNTAEQHKKQPVLEIIAKDNNLSWHFLKNLNDLSWFPVLKNNMIKTIVKQDIDTVLKYQLLRYFEKCMDKYSDEIIPLLIEFEKNTKNPNILSALIETIGSLKPSNKENLKLIWEILKRLSEHQHPWVRRQIPKTLKKLIEYDVDKVLKLLEKLFLYDPVPQDVTQGSPTLALTFQGKDNENWVFEETISVLVSLMSNPKYTLKAYDLAIKMEIHFISQGEKALHKQKTLTLDYSSIWLSEKIPFEKLEYRFDRKERIALEMEKYLVNYAKSNNELAEELFKKLIVPRFEVLHLVVIKVLTRNINQFVPLIENIIFDQKLWYISNIRNHYLQLLIQKYFEIKQERLNEYIDKVKKVKCKDKKQVSYLVQSLLSSIPDTVRNKNVKASLADIEKNTKIPSVVEKPFEVTQWKGPQPPIEFDELKKKPVDELIQIMKDSTAEKWKMVIYDLGPSFERLIKESPEQFPIILDKLKGKDIDRGFVGYMMKAYIDVKRERLEEILDTFWKLEKTDTWARKEVINFLNSNHRKKETKGINNELFNKIKPVLFDLATDIDPENDETIKSSNPMPQDAVMRAINSVRGVAAETLIVFSHYFPKDKELIENIKRLSQDKTKAVKANLVYNLKYLVTKNYSLCKYIANQFKNMRDPEIDHALIHYFASFDPKKFKANIAFVKLLFNNSNAEIQKELGKLIGYRQVDKRFNLGEITDAIIKQRLGTVETRRSLAFVFESQLSNLIDKKDFRKNLKYLLGLLDIQNEPDFQVRERLSFALERKELKTNYFKILYKNKIFNSMLKDRLNVRVQGHIIDYIDRCIIDKESINDCIKILHSQIMNIEEVLSDPIISHKIADILQRIFEDKNIRVKSMVLVDMIFDKGLERGWNEFYDLFKKYKLKLHGATK